MSQLPPLLKPILPPLLKPAPTPEDKWTAHKVDYNRMYLYCSGDLTRLEAMRLIGELERIAASL
jgi:hypothetical protein